MALTEYINRNYALTQKLQWFVEPKTPFLDAIGANGICFTKLLQMF